MIRRVEIRLYEGMFTACLVFLSLHSLVTHGQTVNLSFMLPGSYTSISSQLCIIEDTVYINMSRWDIGTNLIRRGVAKISEAGDVVYSRDFGLLMRDMYPGHRSMVYADNHIFLSSTSQDSQSVVRSHFYKCDLQGNTVWTREYTSATGFLATYSLIAHPEGGFVLLGIVKEQNFDRSDIFILRTDTAGNELWRKTYGSQNKSEEPNPTFVHITAESYFIGGGERIFPPNYPTDPYYYQMFLLKLDNNGNFTRKNLSGPNQSEKIPSGIIKVSDGNFVYGSNISNPNIPYSTITKGLAVKIDDPGDVIWEKEIGDYALFTNLALVRELPNGNLVFAGRMNKGKPLGQEDGWIVTLASDGNLVSQTTFTWPGYGTTDAMSMALRDIILLPDGRVAGCGDIVTDKQRIWFFVSDENGCFDQFCTYLGEQVNETQEGFAVYPNPAQDWLYVYNPYVGLALNARLVNLRGQVVFSQLALHGETTNAVSVSALPSGIYFLQISLSDGKVVTEKVIKN